MQFEIIQNPIRWLSMFILLLLVSSCAQQKISLESNKNFGEIQVVAMLKDRPLMAEYLNKKGTLQYVTKNDSIWKWAAEKYSGKDFGRPISWYADAQVNSGAMAFHNYIKEYIHVVIENSYGTSKLTFEYFWMLASFELLNIEGKNEFKKNHEQVLNCELSENEYITANLKVEYNAIVKQRVFYREIWLPWAEKNNFNSNKTYWNHDASFEVLLSKLKKSSFPNGWLYWRNFYKESIWPRIKNKCIK